MVQNYSFLMICAKKCFFFIKFFRKNTSLSDIFSKFACLHFIVKTKKAY